jgi:pyridoxamine 5'-phosphate oxidase
MASSSPFASWLRAQPSLTGTPPELDTRAVPFDPTTLFEQWVREAVAAGVAESHAGTLATVDSRGMPDARTLIIKDVSEHGWAFAGPRDSAKGRQLAVAPAAAMNFWWQPLRRAARLRGRVQEASADESAADLAERSAAARAGLGPEDWVRWWLVPEHVEFWQGAPDRRHVRIVYTRGADGWHRGIENGESSDE